MIEFTADAMESVRAAVVGGYYKLARGGVEVGGVLFGRRNEHGVRIAAARPIACQYAYGPSFVLSEGDRAGLASLLERSAGEPALEGLVPVGWYHSHTRSGFDLSEQDLDICARYFSEAWQVALVVCPERHGPTRGTFHVQAQDGSPRAEPAFVLEPHATPRRTPPAPAAPPAPVEPPLPETVAPETLPEQSAPLPAEIVITAPRSSRMYWVLFAVAWCIAAASAIFAFRSYWMPQSPASAREDLRVQELTRQVQDLQAELEAQRKQSAEQKK
jgi:proteasome lid subunit RPN8/RPN11